MKKFLLTTTAIVAFATHLQLARAAEVEPIGSMDYRETFMSFEGGLVFDASPANSDFDNDSDKLGTLASLQPGDWGGQGRFELGQQLSNNWDFKITAASTFLSHNDEKESVDTSTSTGVAEASQKTSFRTFDVEVGFQTDGFGSIDARLFAGARAMHSTTELDWNFEGDVIKLGDTTEHGEFRDDVWAIGPRVGVDLAVPLNSTSVSLVGSASGSLLYGNGRSQYDYDGDDRGEHTDWSDSEKIWNVEVMAGVALDIDDNAALTIGYRAARFADLVAERSEIQSDGNFDKGGTSDLVVHGPFARLAIEIP